MSAKDLLEIIELISFIAQKRTERCKLRKKKLRVTFCCYDAACKYIRWSSCIAGNVHIKRNVNDNGTLFMLHWRSCSFINFRCSPFQKLDRLASSYSSMLSLSRFAVQQLAYAEQKTKWFSSNGSKVQNGRARNV